MPLTKRAISPVNVSRGTIPPSIRRDELQCVANGTIANLTRQLSSLSKHAENIFGEIYHDAMVIYHKSNTLQQRIDRLHAKGVEFDANSDQAALTESQMRKAFKSSMLGDHCIFDPSTRSVALAERYAQCDRPPDLDALNPYRDSDIPALALYTNPEFFFDLWKKETLKDVPERPRRVKSPNDGSKSPKKRRKAQVQLGPMGTPVYNDTHHLRSRQTSGSRINQHNEVFSFPEEYQAPQTLGLQLNFKNHNQHPSNQHFVAPVGMTMHHHPQQNAHPMQSHRPSAAAQRGSPIVKRTPDAIPSTINLDHLPPPDMSILSIDDEDDDLPPPPPPLLMHTSIVHQLPAEVPSSTIQFVEPSAAPPTNVPPPPPPPPPMPSNLAAASFAAPKPAADSEQGTSSGASTDRKPTDARSDLLAQIQSGFKLKKVQRAEAEAAEKAALETNNVAAILKRRMDQVMGNDDSSSDEGADDDEWDD